MVALLAVIILLVLFLRCRRASETISPAPGGAGKVSTSAGGTGSQGGRGSASAEQGGRARGGGGGGGGDGDLAITSTPGGGDGSGSGGGGGGGGGGGAPLPAGGGDDGDLALGGSGSAGAPRSGHEQAGTDRGGANKQRPEPARSRLETALPKTWPGFSSSVQSVVAADPNRKPPPTADSASVDFEDQDAGRRRKIEVSIIDAPWTPIVVGASTFAKAKVSGRPEISFQNAVGDFQRGSYLDARPVEESWWASAKENKLTFAVAGRWTVFVRTRELPDTVALEVARAVDVKLLEQLATEIPPRAP
ncbi:MAG: hypothetical protein SFX73_14940 [Kofleriaceae bacterium]|nr:hypothetical protein [Kofleriaceae bacterium]